MTHHRKRGRPENIDHYQDTGCSVSRTCLACPLPVCRYELDIGQQRGALTQQRDSMIRKIRVAGGTAAQIAEAAGVSTRTVYRVLRAEKARAVA